MENYLREGDVFELKEGHQVYYKVPEHFRFSNRKGVFDKLTKMKVLVGTQVQGAEPFDTNFLKGDYVVVHTELSGGGTGHGPHDVYPDGHYVKARKFDDNKDNETAIEVEFYQSGAFTAMILPEEVEVKGKAKAKIRYSFEPSE